jgi:hypothetical protein
MALDFGAVGREPLPRGLEIQPVADTESLRTAADTLAKGFGLLGEIGKGVADAVMIYGINPKRGWFLGRLNGKAATVSLLVLHDEFPGIYCVGTVPARPEARA